MAKKIVDGNSLTKFPIMGPWEYAFPYFNHILRDDLSLLPKDDELKQLAKEHADYRMGAVVVPFLEFAILSLLYIIFW